jgi:hypothetical protein
MVLMAALFHQVVVAVATSERMAPLFHQVVVVVATSEMTREFPWPALGQTRSQRFIPAH